MIIKIDAPDATEREKLIELLKLSDACICTLCGEKGSLNRVTGVIADNLIAGGVTVQEWISVKDRLPEEYETVLVYNGDYVEPSDFHGERGFWTTDCYEADIICGVTHWMPLPEPPKGE